MNVNKPNLFPETTSLRKLYHVLLLGSIIAAVGVALIILLPKVSVATETITLHTETGAHKLNVYIADTKEAREQGLMNKKSLGRNDGMLFLYDTTDQHTMWMKNTYLALDILFLDSKGHIIHIHKNAEPHSTNLISAPLPSKAVLEVAAGSLDKAKVKNGDRVTYTAFNTDP